MEKEKSKYYILDQTGKEIVLNVFNYFKKTLNTSSAVAEASKATGVSERVIYRIKKEKETSALKPPEKRGRKPKDHLEHMTLCDEYTKYRIRKLVNSFFSQNISPTLNMLLSAIKNDDTLQNISRSSLHRLLKNIGFNYESFKNKNVLHERPDIVKWRNEFLQAIWEYRNEGRPIIYTDETSITIGDPHKTPEPDSNALAENVEQTSAEEEPSKKRKRRNYSSRFVLFHAGGEEGFINEAEFHFLCKKNIVDALNEVDEEKYEAWFQEKLLPNTPERCVIVLDNASYHSREFKDFVSLGMGQDIRIGKETGENTATDNTSSSPKKKSKTQKKKAKSSEEPVIKYKLDVIAEISGRTVLRFPPYHCELSPMEMIWNQVRRIMAERGISIAEAYTQITVEDWKNYIEQVQKAENDMRKTGDLQQDHHNHEVDDADLSDLISYSPYSPSLYSIETKSCSVLVQSPHEDGEIATNSIPGPSGELWFNCNKENENST